MLICDSFDCNDDIVSVVLIQFMPFCQISSGCMHSCSARGLVKLVHHCSRNANISGILSFMHLGELDVPVFSLSLRKRPNSIKIVSPKVRHAIAVQFVVTASRGFELPK